MRLRFQNLIKERKIKIKFLNERSLHENVALKKCKKQMN